MKKIILVLFSLGLFITNANAGINGACNIITVPPMNGPALQAYCWNIAYLSSDFNKSWENVTKKSSTAYNHGGRVYVKVDVFGRESGTMAKLNTTNMVLYKTENIINQYNILIGQRYWYQTRETNLDSGTINLYHYSSFKDRVYFL
ncbi:DUF4879 domain-containing protein [Aliarcobacter butzleri]|uniref:DUF4879 domain-containing protein n=1 Tax=Aliarcobacter butzleri TaxID=28197 RepID=UPI0021B25E05|nr:DUF4879 domain-containing protein [Aliarcobacter butzleri]MCT7610238.1 DUF4879 domain-containing protein [Aliarcobacter butzleri]